MIYLPPECFDDATAIPSSASDLAAFSTDTATGTLDRIDITKALIPQDFHVSEPQADQTSYIHKVDKHKPHKPGADPKQRQAQRGRPKDPNKAKGTDKRKKQATKAIDHTAKREIMDGFRHMVEIRKEPVGHLSLHPAYLAAYPADVGAFFKDDFRNRMARRFKTMGGWYGLWAREAYTKDRSEHLHMLLWMSESDTLQALNDEILSWYPGADPRLVEINPVAWKEEHGRIKCVQLGYILKQMTPQAQGPIKDKDGNLRKDRMTRETERKDKKTGEVYKVAPVMGRRSGVTNSVNASAIETHKASGRIRRERFMVDAARRAEARLTFLTGPALQPVDDNDFWEWLGKELTRSDGGYVPHPFFQSEAYDRIKAEWFAEFLPTQSSERSTVTHIASREERHAQEILMSGTL